MARRDRRTSAAARIAPTIPLGEEVPISTGSARVTAETDGSMLLEVNGVPSSHLHPDPRHLVFEYMRWMKLVIDLLPGIGEDRLEIAHLGGAGCALPRALAAEHPRLRQTVVEIDALLAEHVREWFDLPRSPQLRIRVEDAAAALASWRPNRYAVLTRDVFAGAITPPPLVSRTAAENAHRVLTTGGVYLANSAAPPGTKVLADEVATLGSVFREIAVIAEPAHLSGKRRGNCVIVCSDQPLPEDLDRRLRSDAVSVRLATRRQLSDLRRTGRILEAR